MSTITAALCDDDPTWLVQAEHVLEDYAHHSGMVLDLQAFSDGTTMLATCPQAPDVLFCDIELGPDKNGIDLVQEVKCAWPSCQVVYVTNYLRYAPDVYVTEHLWFALKDTFEDRLPEIMEKLAHQMEDVSHALAVETTDHSLLSLSCTHIVSLERRGRETVITCDDGCSYQVPDRLPTLLDRLPQRLFVQCHGSFAVGLSHVRLVKRDAIVMSGGVEIPLSRRHARAFRDRYLDWVDDHAL